MNTFDVYAMTDKLNSTILDVIVTRLEARGKHPFFQKMMHEYLDAMAIDSAQTVLDIGCGTGVAARGVAHRTSFLGKVTGIDLSPHLIAAAQQFSEAESVSSQIDFQVGDGRSLDISHRKFDAVIAHTLVSHVD